MRVTLLCGTAAVAALILAGCGGHQSAVQSQGGGGAASSSGGNAGGSYSGGSEAPSQASLDDHRREPVPMVNGKPMWAPNRKHTAEENAEYQFTKNGSDFDAKTESDYVTKVQAFVGSPPSDAETIARSNGDKLIYDPKTNTFAVVTKDGAPRTMFKPRDGASYWQQQKDEQARNDKGGGYGGGSYGGGGSGSSQN